MMLIGGHVRAERERERERDILITHVLDAVTNLGLENYATADEIHSQPQPIASRYPF
jgi:hypothetical protein